MSKDISQTSKQLAEEVRLSINRLAGQKKSADSGTVTRVGDGVAWIWGLTACGYNDMLSIETVDGKTADAFALNLMEDEIGAVLLSSESEVRAGAKVSLSGDVMSVPVGEELIGRIVDPLGRPLDGKGPIKTKQRGLIEKIAPGVIERRSVHEPLMTGITAIDTMVPIGRGQRELIIGDRQTGKTAIVLDTMINQAKQSTGVINIYVAVGQKNAKIARLVERLKQEGAMDSSIIVATSAADSAPMQFIAPYAGCAMGEYFRDNKKHALIAYDDLTKHAAAYRQMSLLLRRPPGREAYPGDVFYLHSRLLERSAKLSDTLGGGSLTALPIIETQAGDVSAYIPTNVISITDGQIYLETDLFYQGIRPAISVGLSVSRVGGSAQTKAVKSVASSLRLALAQYRELAAFAQFSSDLDDNTKKSLARGQLLTELLKQPQYATLSVWQHTALMLAANEGKFDNLPIAEVKKAKDAFLNDLSTHHKTLMSELDEGDQPSEAAKKAIFAVAEKIVKPYQAAPAVKGGQNG